MQRTILIVNDDPIFCAMLRPSSLRPATARVLLPQRISQALELTWTLDSELAAAMIDLVLANESGLDALHEIRRILPDVPVIVFVATPATRTLPWRKDWGQSGQYGNPSLRIGYLDTRCCWMKRFSRGREIGTGVGGLTCLNGYGVTE